MAKGLTRKQEVFVAEYLVHSDGKRAAIAAGYSEKSAESQASQLLKNPKVSEVITKKTEKILGKLELSAEYVLEGIKDTIEYCKSEGQPMGALKGYELLGKHLKLFTDKAEITGANGSPIGIAVEFIE